MQHLKLSALILLAGLLMMAALSAATARSAPPPPGDTGLPRPYWLRLDPARPVETTLPSLLRALARRQAVGDVVRFDRVPRGGALRMVARPGAADELRSLPGVVGVSDAPPGPKPTPAPSGKVGILATGAIAGVVTAAGSGARLSEIEVCAESDYAYECDTTGSSGTYTIGGLDTDSYRVDFYDDGGGYVYQYYHNKPDWDSADLVAVTDGAVTPNINATLVRAGHVAGTVTAEGSGAPLSDITVCADNDTTDECAYTDDDGTYNIGSLGTGSYTVDFYDDSDTYAEEYYNNKPDQDTADLVGVTAGKTTRAINAVLSLPGHITGAVTAEESGAGLGDISVCADRGVWYDDTHCTTTDDTGVYDIDGLNTGSYRVQFTDDGGVYASEYYNNRPDWDTANLVAVTAGRTTRAVNAALAVRGHIAGVVTAESGGAPLSGIDVCVYSGVGWDYDDETCATTDGGVYSMGGLDSGSYRVWFRDASATYVGEYYDDKPELDWSNSVAVTGGITTSNINAALARPGHLTGTVTAEGSGAPLSDITVCADDTANGYNDDEYCATTDGGGTYDIGGLPGGAYQVVFYANSLAYVGEYYADKPEADEADWVAVTAGSSTPNINAALSAAGHSTGVVTAAGGGEPLDSIEVCADNGIWDSCTSTDSNGAYDIGGLGAGSYKVMFRNEDDWGDYARAYYHDNSWATADPVSVTAGSTTPDINAALSAGGHITGWVGLEGEDLDEIDVCAEDGNGYDAYCTVAGSGGFYDIGGLPGGRYRVQFGGGYDRRLGTEYYDNKSQDTADWISVPAGGTISGIDATLSQPGDIAGVVTAEGSGTPLIGIQVCTGEGICAVTDGDGAYDIYGLGARSFKIKFSDARRVYAGEFYNNKPSSSAADPVAVAAGRTTRAINAALSASGHITGTVTEAGGGAPLVNIEVTAYRYNGAGWDEVGVTHTDSAGRYDITLPSGTYRIRFEDWWWGDLLARYYWDGATPGGATSISLTAPATVPDMNATLSRPSAWVYLPIIIRK